MAIRRRNQRILRPFGRCNTAPIDQAKRRQDCAFEPCVTSTLLVLEVQWENDDCRHSHVDDRRVGGPHRGESADDPLYNRSASCPSLAGRGLISGVT